MATPAPETSIDSIENTSQTNTISNTINNSMSNMSSSTVTDTSSDKLELSSTGNITNVSNVTNGSNLRYEILPQEQLNLSNKKLPLKKTSTNDGTY